MVNRKPVRTRGKLQLSKYFQEFKSGDSVAVIKNVAIQPRFPPRIQGRTGVVEGIRGRSILVKITDMNKEKKFLIAPIHLKKIKQIKK